MSDDPLDGASVGASGKSLRRNGFMALGGVTPPGHDEVVFEELATAVDEVEVPVDAAALVEVLGLIDRLTAKATMASAAFELPACGSSTGTRR